MFGRRFKASFFVVYALTAKRGFVLQGWENFLGQEEEEEVKNKRLIISSELAATAQTILYAFELCPCRMNAEETAAAIPKGKRNCENVFTRPSSVLHTFSIMSIKATSSLETPIEHFMAPRDW